MLDTVITQDTNCDGSFGKLKLKNSAHSVLQDTFIQMDDVQRFVSSMAPRGTTDQNKRKLSQAVIKVISGVTQLLGTFVHEVGAIGIGQNEETSGPSLRRSKRKRTTEHEEPELVHEDIAEDSDYEEEPEFVDEETTEESDYEDEGDADYEGDAYHTSNIDPIPEGGEEAGNGAHGTIPDGQRSASNLEHDQTDEEEHMPLISRLRAIQQAAHHKGSDEQEHNQRRREQAAHHDVVCEPVALEVMPPTQVGTVPPASKPVTIKERKLRLKLPTVTGTSFDATKDNKSGEGCSHKMSNASPISRSNSLDFTPPDFDIMKSIDEQEPTTSGWQLSTPQLDNHSGLQGNDPSSSCSLDQIECEFWQKVEEDAIEQVKKRKVSSAQLEGATVVDIKGHEDAVQIRTDVAATVVGTTITPVSVRKEPGSVNSSVTPAYHPAPRRQPRKGAALQSPYVGITAVNSFRCSKDVCDVYNAVLASQGPTTRSSPKSKKEVIIINYYDFHITLNELALLVKPGGKLDCVVAEIGLFAIDPVGRKATKRVLPLRVAGYLQSGQLTRSEVKRVFRLGTNHLDHRQMVIFPVLQMIYQKDLDMMVGHYFLLVLNICNSRFEVLDSWRSLEDEHLCGCCNIITDGIKELWKIHYPDSKVDIANYNLVDIDVPLQTNKMGQKTGERFWACHRVSFGRWQPGVQEVGHKYILYSRNQIVEQNATKASPHASLRLQVQKNGASTEERWKTQNGKARKELLVCRFIGRQTTFVLGSAHAPVFTCATDLLLLLFFWIRWTDRSTFSAG